MFVSDMRNDLTTKKMFIGACEGTKENENWTHVSIYHDKWDFMGFCRKRIDTLNTFSVKI